MLNRGIEFSSLKEIEVGDLIISSYYNRDDFAYIFKIDDKNIYYRWYFTGHILIESIEIHNFIAASNHWRLIKHK